MMKDAVLAIYFMLACCALSQLGLMVLLLQELVSACCSTRAFMVFEMKERMGNCHNVLHVLRDMAGVENKKGGVGGALARTLLCI